MASQTQEDKIEDANAEVNNVVTKKRTAVEQTNPEPQQPMSKKQIIIEKLLLCIALFFPLFLATLDTTIVATALPHIASSFDQLPDESWIANAYILTNTAFLPAYGQVADIFGRHIVMQSGIFIFLVGSALCTGAQTWGMMMAGRAISGVGAAGCFIMTKIVMSDTNSLKENSTQNTFLSLMFAVAYSIGPVLGGVLTSVSWRWCFAINLPICVVAHIIFFFVLRKKVRPSTYDTAEEHRSIGFKLRKIDYLGLVFFLGSCVCIILALVWGGSTYPWTDGRVIVLLVVGPILLILFLATEWLFEEKNRHRAPAFIRPFFIHGTPMIPLEIFRDWDVVICQWANLVGGLVMYGQFYYIAIYFTIVFLYSPQEAGQQLLYFLPGLGVGVWSAMLLINKVFKGTKVTLVFGSVVMAVATGLFSMAAADMSKPELFGFMAMLGVGVGLTLMPTQLHTQARMMHYLAIVTSLVSFFRSLGGILALTIMSSVVNNKLASAFPSATSNGSQLSSLNSIKSLPPAVLTAVQNAFADAVRWAYIAILPFACVSALTTIFLREVKVEKTPVEQAEQKEMQAKTDAELGQIQHTNEDGAAGSAAQPPAHKPRIRIWGPISAIIWCCQAFGDKTGWRK